MIYHSDEFSIKARYAFELAASKRRKQLTLNRCKMRPSTTQGNTIEKSKYQSAQNYARRRRNHLNNVNCRPQVICECITRPFLTSMAKMVAT